MNNGTTNNTSNIIEQINNFPLLASMYEKNKCSSESRKEIFKCLCTKLEQEPEKFRLFTKENIKNKQFVKAFINKVPKVFKYLYTTGDNLYFDKSFTLESLQDTPETIKYINEDYLNNIDFLKAAISSETAEYVFEHINNLDRKRMLNNYEIALELIKYKPGIFKKLDYQLQNDEYFVKTAIDNNLNVINELQGRHLTNQSIVETAVYNIEKYALNKGVPTTKLSFIENDFKDYIKHSKESDIKNIVQKVTDSIKDITTDIEITQIFNSTKNKFR